MCRQWVRLGTSTKNTGKRAHKHCTASVWRASKASTGANVALIDAHVNANVHVDGTGGFSIEERSAQFSTTVRKSSVLRKRKADLEGDRYLHPLALEEPWLN